MDVDFPPLSSEIQTHRTEATLSGAYNWHNSSSQQDQTWSQVMSTGKNRYVLQKKNISKSTNNKFFITRDIIERGSLDWKNVIVGFFFDASFGFRYVERILRNKWSLKGSLEINADKSFFYLTFSSDEDRKIALDGGPFFIDGKVFVLREWNHNIEVEKMSCKSLPIWAKFWDIPKFLWNSEGLSTIASCIGNPLFADSNTMEKRRLGYARLCIEVDSSFEFPEKLHFESELLEFSVDVEYQWIPIKCRNCNCFGHHFHQCKLPTRREEEVQTARQNVVIVGSEQEKVSDGLNKTNETPVVMNSMAEAAYTSVPTDKVIQVSEAEKEINSELVVEKVTEVVVNKADVIEKVTKVVLETNEIEDHVEFIGGSSNSSPVPKNSDLIQQNLKEAVTQENGTSNVAEKQMKTVEENQNRRPDVNSSNSSKKNKNQQNNKKIDERGGNRKIMGRMEVVHIQKERDNKARTRSGAVSHTSYSTVTQRDDDFARQFYEDSDEYDADGVSQPDEDEIPIVDGVPMVLKSYPDNNSKGSKAKNKKAVAAPNFEKGSKNKDIGPQNNRPRNRNR